ncbi:MAG: 5-formyltetrahydrofolate cyclo-ligase [Eubacteriales bacterium]|nr:5-formyltetrahydrofolate cyclo-ligase [Eubacteriales bacterium]
MFNEDKKSIRELIKEKKSLLTQEDIALKSRKIMGTIMQLDQYKSSDKVFTYVNFNEEVVTSGLIVESLNNKKKVFVPKVFKGEKNFMEFVEIHDLSELREGYYGVMEPQAGLDAKTDIREGLFIMPGLAFDRNFHRIGYGGGFYDRFLSRPHKFDMVAVAFDFQLMDNIPFEEHDLRPEIIVTDNEVLVR